MKHLLTTAAALFAASTIHAATVGYGDWSHQKFPLKTAVIYGQSSSSLSINAQSAVSILYRAVSDASSASWNWSVSSSVPATNLSNKGGDDRNIAIYFIFAPSGEANALRNQSATSLLRNSSVKALVYTHGGNAARGTKFSNPYMQGRGQSVILRPAGTGSHNENVNLKTDYANAFGGNGELIGIAISSDSDDSKANVNAQISAITLN